jgi:PBS lyase HEAT-like repeat
MQCHPTLQRALRGATLALLVLASSCASDGGSSSVIDDSQTFEAIGPSSRSDDSIGMYLGDLSTSMNAWMEKTMTATTNQERNTQALLQINITERVRKRQDEILTELETGPTRNRVIAAAAIGFCGDPAVLSPLIAALDDPNEKVVSNALLGLTVLDSPDTPLGEVADLMTYATEAKTRWSAANCARSLIEAGADGAPVLSAARSGLTDVEEPMVRTQSALIVARLKDDESIDALASLLYDEAPIVSSSAARALAYIGREVDTAKGDCARALVTALAEGDRDLQERIHPSLVELSRRNFDLDLELWAEWVARQP